MNSTNLGEQFKFNGVELNSDMDLGLYEMDFRQYDPTIGRFTSVDPVTHYDYSTFAAFDNNPVFWADPSGADSIYNWDTGQYVINGQVVSQEEAVAYANSGGNADGSNNNTPNKECPDCDDKDLLLNFTKDAAIQHAIDMANDQIHYAKNGLDPEIHHTNSNSVLVQKLIKISGNNRLKYRTGFKNFIKYVTAGTGDYNRYEFLQKFYLLLKDGSSKEFNARGTIFIKANESDMNLAYYGFPVSGVGLDEGHVISFFNGKGSLVARLSFGSEAILSAFTNKYFNKVYVAKKNEIIRSYNESKK